MIGANLLDLSLRSSQIKYPKNVLAMMGLRWSGGFALSSRRWEKDFRLVLQSKHRVVYFPMVG